MRTCFFRGKNTIRFRFLSKSELVHIFRPPLVRSTRGHPRSSSEISSEIFIFSLCHPLLPLCNRTSAFATMSAQMLASSVAASAVAPRFGKKASGVSARKAISAVPVRSAKVQVRNKQNEPDCPDCIRPREFG